MRLPYSDWGKFANKEAKKDNFNKQMELREKSNSYFKKSLFFHVAFFLLIALFHNVNPPIQKRRVVHTTTVKLSSPANATLAATASVPATKPETKKEKVAKKESPKKPEAKKEVAKVDTKKETLLKEARDSLAKMGKVEATSVPVDRSSRSALSSLKAEGMNFSVKGVDNDLYTSELIQRLKLSLRLPESGEVIVDLTLKRNGKIAGIKIRDAKSSTNKYYVESQLPTLNFPEFGESYPNNDEKLFTLTLQNAIF